MTMEIWSARRVAYSAGADLRREPRAGDYGPRRVVVDSRAVEPGDLFVGLPGERTDGGTFASAALAAGAWGVLVAPSHAEALQGEGAVLSSEEPLAALGRLAQAWRKDLAAYVIGVTGSVGKTTTKDIIAAVLAPHRKLVASRANYNTEIGLPLELLSAPQGTELIVLEMAMRGAGQIAELAEIAAPDVGVVTNVGPVHLEQLGTLDAIARAKGELLQALPEQGAAVIPAGEPLLARLVAEGADTITFGPDGDVRWLDAEEGLVSVLDEEVMVDLAEPLRSDHNRLNVLAALGAAAALGVRISGPIDVALAPLHGERVELLSGAVAINDCYNANPMSMAAALRELGRAGAHGRKVAVLGDMLELGAEEAARHRRLGHLANEAGVDLLVTVGPRAVAALESFDGEEAHGVADAAEAVGLLGDLLADGDLVLIKGSRGVGLEVVCAALGAVAPAPDGDSDGPN